MPFQDRLRTSISEVLREFGCMLGPFGSPCGGPVATFLAMFGRLNFNWIFCCISGAGRGCHAEQPAADDEAPGMQLVTFGIKTHGFERERLHFQDFRDTYSTQRTDFGSVLS